MLFADAAAEEILSRWNLAEVGPATSQRASSTHWFASMTPGKLSVVKSVTGAVQ